MTGAHIVLVLGMTISGAAAGGFMLQDDTGANQHTSTPHARVDNPHGPISIPCKDCHTNTSWKPIRAYPEFNHDTTGYPLRGMHKSVACSACHTSLVFHNVGTHCADCHADIHRGQMGANCESCHSVQGWQVSLQAIRNHDNRFPLVGAHALVDCVGCHKGAAVGQFQGLSTECLSCHQQDFQTKAINHVALGFPTTCQSCHTMDTWFNAKFDHLKYTGYALTGAHAALACDQCHTNNVFTGTPTACYSCHAANFNTTTNPNHAAAGFPHDCSVCHSTASWEGVNFNHAVYASYPLTGAHATLQCVQCHVNNVYTGTPTDCYSCHKVDYTGTTDPNHVAAGFPTTCDTCHTTVAWTGAIFNHNNTPFPLTGAHVNVACTQCHVNNVFAGTPTDCYSCHKADYAGTTDPNHVSAGFPTTCDTCHTTVAWTVATFNHNNTPFPLTGAHVNVACTQCHVNNVFAGTPTDCYSCHKADYTGTTDPNHVAAGFPTTCDLCHTTTAWTGATFSHSTTGFPLTGAHASLQCVQCHVNNNYSGSLPTDCYSCHKADFTGTTNPNHVSSGFPTDCSICHSTTAWIPSSFDHSTTGFPLTGAHTTLQCVQCHVNNNYSGSLPTDCYSCHTADWNGTTNPNHAAAGFPTTCATCHTTTSWAGATFNHNNTPFPLTGAHVNVACNQCHINNVFAGTPTDCYSCHQADYTGTTNPNHAAAGFPTTCATCHTTTSWLGATFNHTWFNMNHGGANGVCSTCHTNSSDYSVFQCTNCHAKTETDDNHKGISGYVYNSVNCYACHKNAGGG